MRELAFSKLSLQAAALLLLGSVTGANVAEATVQPSAPEATQAQETDPVEAPPAPDAATGAEQPDPSHEWQFATIGYAWLAGVEGETDIIGPVDPVGLDLSFGDVLDAFKFAFMGAAEARHDRLVILADLTFIHLDANKGIDVRGQDFLDAEIDSRTAEITLLGGYRAVNKGPVAVDLLAGGRMNFFKTTLQLDGPNGSAEGTVKQTWLDPLIGARVQGPLGGKWSYSLYGDLGGILFGSDLTFQGVGTINYDISRKMQLGVGWRYYTINYDNGDFLYDVDQSGPFIAFKTIL